MSSAPLLATKQCKKARQYLVYTISEQDNKTLAKNELGESKATTSPARREKVVSVPKKIYLESNLRKISEDESKLYLKRTRETYRLPDERENIELNENRGSNYNVQPLLAWMPVEEIKDVDEDDENNVKNEISEEEIEVLTRKRKRLSIIDSSVPIKRTSAKEDLEILKRFHGIRLILDEDYKLAIREKEHLEETKEMIEEAVDLKGDKTKEDETNTGDIDFNKTEEIQVNNNEAIAVEEEVEVVDLKHEETEEDETNTGDIGFNETKKTQVNDKEDITVNEIEEVDLKGEKTKDEINIGDTGFNKTKEIQVNDKQDIAVGDEISITGVTKVDKSEGISPKHTKVYEMDKRKVCSKNCKYNKTNVRDNIIMNNDGQLNVVEETVKGDKKLNLLEKTEIDTDKKEIVKEVKQLSRPIYLKQSEAQEVVMDFMNSLVLRLVQEINSKDVRRKCKCRKKKKGIRNIFKKKKNKKDCKCSKKKEIVATQTVFSMFQTVVDKEIQNVMQEMYHRIPSKHFIQLDKISLEKSLVTTHSVKQSDLMYMDINDEGTVVIPTDYNMIGRQTMNVNGLNMAQSYSFLENLLRKPVPAVLNAEASIKETNETSNTPTIKSLENSSTFLVTSTREDNTQVFDVSSSSRTLNIVINSTQVNIQVTPTTRGIFVVYGDSVHRLS